MITLSEILNVYLCPYDQQLLYRAWYIIFVIYYEKEIEKSPTRQV